MKYMATISGGKDSVTGTDLLLKNGYQVDEIIFSDTLQEFKMMYTYIDKLKKYFKDRYGRDITVLTPESKFEDWCFGEITRGDRKGQIRGIPLNSGGVCYWRRESKIKPQEKYIKEKYPDEKITFYIGYTMGEDRSIKDTDNISYKYPLQNVFKMREEDCKKYLIEQEMENPLYRYFSRTGCRMCPFQSEKAFYNIYKFFPEDWEYMKNIEEELQELEKQGKTIVNKYWFNGYRTTNDMEKIFNNKSNSLFDFSDEPLKDCFCKI